MKRNICICFTVIFVTMCGSLTYGDDSAYFYGTLKDKTGNIVTDAEINFVFSDVYFTSYSDSNGHYSVKLENILASVKKKDFPAEFRLFQNFPNPFNPLTTISFELKQQSDVRLRIYNILGQPVRLLLSGETAAGLHTVRWDGTDDSGRDVGAGLYFYQLRSGHRSVTRKMIMVDGGNSYASSSLSTGHIVSEKRVNTETAPETDFEITVTTKENESFSGGNFSLPDSEHILPLEYYSFNLDLNIEDSRVISRGCEYGWTLYTERYENLFTTMFFNGVYSSYCMDDQVTNEKNNGKPIKEKGRYSLEGNTIHVIIDESDLPERVNTTIDLQWWKPTQVNLFFTHAEILSLGVAEDYSEMFEITSH